MELLVCHIGSFLSKAPPAFSTFEGLHVRMDQLMPNEVDFGAETFTTLRTAKRFLSRVNSLMDHATGLLSEALATMVANKWFFTGMDPLVSHKRSLLSEAFTTL